MANIVCNSPQKTLLSLFNSKETIGKLVLGCEKALRHSFDVRPMREITAFEKKRRASLAIEIARQLRGDCKWGVDKIVSHLPQYLVAEIDNVSWKPETRMIWSA